MVKSVHVDVGEMSTYATDAKELSPEDLTRIEAHFKACDECQETLEVVLEGLAEYDNMK